jgi:serine/threonine protein kinase/formylglycine-generating enzyme required for sulfatase activity
VAEESQQPSNGKKPGMQCPVCHRLFEAGAKHCPHDGTILEPADTLVGTVLSKTYKLERLLGKGGMGQVYLATHVRLNKKYAVKVLRPEYNQDREALTRFEREAQTAGGLGHVNILDVVDFNQTEAGLFYIVTEYLAGQSLGQAVAQTGQLSLERAIPIFHQLCRALAVAHENEIVHRDLKPENVFLINAFDTEDFVKVLDFGISKVKTAEAHLTQSGQIIGTPYFMSPEQAEGKLDLDHRSDIYSLGAMMYQVLTGRYPFEAESFQSVLVKVLMEDPPRPRLYRPDLPQDVEDVIVKAMARDPAQRYQSMQELDQAIVALWRSHFAGRSALHQALPGSSAVSDLYASGDATKRTGSGVPPTAMAASGPVVSTGPNLDPALCAPSPPAATGPGRTVPPPPPPKLPVPAVRRRKGWLIGGILAVGLVILGGGGLLLYKLGVFSRGAKEQGTAQDEETKKARRMARQSRVARRGGVPGRDGGVRAAARHAARKTDADGGEVVRAKTVLDAAVNKEKPPKGMVFIKGDTFKMGRAQGGADRERPAHTVVVADFYLDRTEVSNAQYARYIRLSGGKVRAPWPQGAFPVGKEKLPVTRVTWKEADAYCRARKGRRLPTEAEWEYAARSGSQKQHLFPWGPHFSAAKCACEIGQQGTLQPVDSGQPFGGLYHMIGNAWEWTASVYKPYPGSRAKPLKHTQYVMRGGGVHDKEKKYFTATFRWYWHSHRLPGKKKLAVDANLGFRCAFSR